MGGETSAIRSEIIPTEKGLNLPSVIKDTIPALDALTNALGIPRSILASSDEITEAWRNLPRVLNKIPSQHRSPAIAKMCVSVASGLFDSAINYIWNASVVELRKKIQRFGLGVVRQLLEKSDFDEAKLDELKDADLISLCLQLNLITEEGAFFLNQCREIRNNYSAAHPSAQMVDDHEFIAFVNRCAKYALDNTQNPIGVDLHEFITAVKTNKFTDEQKREWVERFTKTHEAQRDLLFGTLHGLYCDPASGEETRINSLMLFQNTMELLTPSIKSELIIRHQSYVAKGDEPRHKASQQLFQKLGITDLLSEKEQHTIISSAYQSLLSVHQGFDNFYNEPPFAERLWELTERSAIPQSAKEGLVVAVVACAIGNGYGVSRAAYPFYEKIIKNFSPAEIAIMLKLPESKTIVGDRIHHYEICRIRYKKALSFIDPRSIPTTAGLKAIYDKWSHE